MRYPPPVNNDNLCKKDHILFAPHTDLKSRFSWEQRQSASIDHILISPGWYLKTGFTVYRIA